MHSIYTQRGRTQAHTEKKFDINSGFALFFGTNFFLFFPRSFLQSVWRVDLCVPRFLILRSFFHFYVFFFARCVRLVYNFPHFVGARSVFARYICLFWCCFIYICIKINVSSLLASVDMCSCGCEWVWLCVCVRVLECFPLIRLQSFMLLLLLRTIFIRMMTMIHHVAHVIVHYIHPATCLHGIHVFCALHRFYRFIFSRSAFLFVFRCFFLVFFPPIST